MEDPNNRDISFAIGHTSAKVKLRAALAEGSTAEREHVGLCGLEFISHGGDPHSEHPVNTSNWPTSVLQPSGEHISKVCVHECMLIPLCVHACMDVCGC